ncbi:hypothetical protein BH23PLA1_BH23PLA1_40130 [soil metagenome]
MNKTIEITVDPKGQTRVETKGFSGHACRQASQFIEQALGQATAEQLKPEYYQQQSTDQHLRQSS